MNRPRRLPAKWFLYKGGNAVHINGNESTSAHHHIAPLVRRRWFYFGPGYGGGGIGLVLLICIIIYLMGGFRGGRR